MKDRIRELELRVIEAAKEDHRGGCAPEACGGSRLDPCALSNAIEALTYGCDECNHNRHRCPGCGAGLAHGQSVCSDCAELHNLTASSDRRRLADYLSEVAHDTVEAWMRLVQVDEDVLSPGSGAMELHVRHAGDGSIMVGETQLSEEYGQYRITVKVEALPDLPPIGPENDPAQIEEMKPSLPEVCGLEWVASTFLHIETGDRLRIGADEATVLSVFKSNWHADVSDPYRPRPWEHVELYADLGFGRTQFPTDTAVEILCDSERKAQLIMSESGLKPRYRKSEEE